MGHSKTTPHSHSAQFPRQTKSQYTFTHATSNTNGPVKNYYGDRKAQVNNTNSFSQAASGGPLAIINVMTNFSRNVIMACVDTASPFSFIKASLLPTGYPIMESKTVNFQGLTNDIIRSLGVVHMQILIPEAVLSVTAHVLADQETGLSHDLLLGTDFQSSHDARIDWSQKEISLRSPTGKVLTFKMNRTPGIIKAPARSFSIQLVKSQTESIGLISNNEIYPGLFVGGGIVSAHKGACYVSMMNMNEVDVCLTNVSVEVEPLAVDTLINTNETTPHELTTPNVALPIHSYSTPRSQAENTNRTKHLLTQIDLNHVSANTRSKLESMISRFDHVFHIKGEPLSCTHLIEHDIALKPNSKIVNQKPHIIPKKHEESFNTMLRDLNREGILEPTTSPWNHRIFLIPKKSGELRAVLDFRALNDLTEPQKYDLPSIEDLLSRIGDAQLFSSLDMSQAYHQIKLSERSKDYCAFSCGKLGRYRYVRTPFGVTGAPYTCQRLIDSIFSSCNEPSLDILAYLDDILIYSESEEAHLKTLESVFQKLSNANLKLNIAKCNFVRTEIKYLGFLIKKGLVYPPEEYLESLRTLKPPRDLKHLESVLGKFGYLQKFIDHYQQKIRPLTKLLKKDTKFEFGDIERETFEEMKESLMKASPLSLPKKGKYCLHIDASAKGYGAMLRNDDGDTTPPIMYLSAVTLPSQLNYSATELEMYALTYFVTKLRHFLAGDRFTVYTDHKPLLSIMKSKNLDNMRLIKMKMSLADFDMEIKYVKGKHNKVPDHLSRYPTNNLAYLDEKTNYLEIHEDPPEQALSDTHNTITPIQSDTHFALPITRAAAKQNAIEELQAALPMGVSACEPKNDTPNTAIELGKKPKKVPAMTVLENDSTELEEQTEKGDFKIVLDNWDSSKQHETYHIATNVAAATSIKLDRCIEIYRRPNKIFNVKVTISETTKITNKHRFGIELYIKKPTNEKFPLLLYAIVDDLISLGTSKKLETLALQIDLTPDQLNQLKQLWAVMAGMDRKLLVI